MTPERSRLDSAAPHRTVLTPLSANQGYWAEVWRYRGLLRVLAWRDVTVRYRQTLIGVAWAVLRPLTVLVAFNVVFGKLARLEADGDAPYALMVLAGLLPWTLFSSILGEASGSLVANANLLGKAYFPRIVIPLATVAVALTDFAVSIGMLIAALIWFGYAPDARVLWLPVLALGTIVVAAGPALWLAALNVRYRDVRYMIPFLLQVGLYVSPVGFSTQIVPGDWRLAYGLNPLVALIEGFRWCLLRGAAPLDLTGLAIGAAVALLGLAGGLAYFRAAESRFADVI